MSKYLTYPDWKRIDVHTKSLQSCPTLCDPLDYSPPGSSVHELNGILQARIVGALLQ